MFCRGSSGGLRRSRLISGRASLGALLAAFWRLALHERASVAGTIVIDRAPVPIRGPDPSMVMGTMMGTVIRVQGECVVRIAGLGGKVETLSLIHISEPTRPY